MKPAFLRGGFSHGLRELRKLDAVHAAREFDALAKLIAEEDC
jgi:hypothetical protein